MGMVNHILAHEPLPGSETIRDQPTVERALHLGPFRICDLPHSFTQYCHTENNYPPCNTTKYCYPGSKKYHELNDAWKLSTARVDPQKWCQVAMFHATCRHNTPDKLTALKEAFRRVAVCDRED